MHFLPILALLIYGLDGAEPAGPGRPDGLDGSSTTNRSYAEKPGDVKERITHFLGRSPSDSALRITNKENHRIVDSARALDRASELVQIHSDYRQLFEPETVANPGFINAEEILDSFPKVNAGPIIGDPSYFYHSIYQNIGRGHPYVLARGSLVNAQSDVFKHYLIIKVKRVSSSRNLPDEGSLLFVFGADGSLTSCRYYNHYVTYTEGVWQSEVLSRLNRLVRGQVVKFDFEYGNTYTEVIVRRKGADSRCAECGCQCAVM